MAVINYYGRSSTGGVIPQSTLIDTSGYGGLGTMGTVQSNNGGSIPIQSRTVGAGASTLAQVQEQNRIRETRNAGYAQAGSTAAKGMEKAMEYASQYFATKMQRATLGMNVSLAQRQIGDIVDAGEYQKAQILEAAQKMAGAQRAATAANGMVVDQGSAARIMAESAQNAAQDTSMTDQNMRAQVAAQQIEIGSMMAQRSALKKLGSAAKVAAISTIASSQINSAGQAYSAYKGGGSNA
jgi:hypothetical protein